MRRLVLLLSFLALTGCWYGIGLYKPSDSQPVIRPGIYQSTAKDEQPKTYSVSLLPNGMTQFDSGEKQETYGVATLDRSASSYVLWLPVKNDDPKGDEPAEYQIYLLMVRQPNGYFLIYPPECSGKQAELARKNGAAIDPGSPPACHFASRASLEAALRELPRDDASAATLKRLP